MHMQPIRSRATIRKPAKIYLHMYVSTATVLDIEFVYTSRSVGVHDGGIAKANAEEYVVPMLANHLSIAVTT